MNSKNILTYVNACFMAILNIALARHLVSIGTSILPQSILLNYSNILFMLLLSWLSQTNRINNISRFSTFVPFLFLPLILTLFFGFHFSALSVILLIISTLGTANLILKCAGQTFLSSLINVPVILNGLIILNVSNQGFGESLNSIDLAYINNFFSLFIFLQPLLSYFILLSLCLNRRFLRF